MAASPVIIPQPTRDMALLHFLRQSNKQTFNLKIFHLLYNNTRQNNSEFHSLTAELFCTLQGAWR